MHFHSKRGGDGRTGQNGRGADAEAHGQAPAAKARLGKIRRAVLTGLIVAPLLAPAAPRTPNAKPAAMPTPAAASPAPHNGKTKVKAGPENGTPEKPDVEAVFEHALTEQISLRTAIEMALQNNLEARFERLGIHLQHAQIRFAAGAFDPVFSMSVQHQSVRIPQDANNPNSGQQIAAQQAAVTQLNQNALNLNSQLQTVQAEALAQAQALQQQLQANLNEGANFQKGLQGLTPLTLGGIVNPQVGQLQQQQLVVQNLNDIVVLDQQNTQSSATLQGRGPYGTRYQFQASVNHFRNTYSGDPQPSDPLDQTFAGITLEQPLLRNFGKDANLADVRSALLNKRAQVLNWKQNVTTAVQGVMATFYDMQYALADIKVRQDAIAADSKLVELYQRRSELGFSTPLDVQQAEVAVSTDREALLLAKNNFLERQFALKRLILSKYEATNARLYVPEFAPPLPPPRIDRSQLLDTAFEHRYDYQTTLIGAELQNVRLKFARNQLLPQLDIVGTYGFNGLASGFAQSRGQIASGDTPQWSIGVQFQVPLGNRQPRAQYNAIALQKEQAILKIQESELTVTADVDTVISRIEINRQRVETSRQTRQLGEEAVRIAYHRLDEGLISAFDVIDQQRKLYDARSREIGSLAELTKSITQLWLVTGTVLEREGINFHEAQTTVGESALGITVGEKWPGSARGK